MKFTPFENALIRWYVDHAPHERFKAQLLSCLPKDREYTGGGMYLELTVHPGSWSKLPDEFRNYVDGPKISSPSLPIGAGTAYS